MTIFRHSGGCKPTMF